MYCGNSIDDQYARVYVRNSVKHINVNLLNLIPRVNKAKSSVQHECALNESIYNSKQKWNND